MTLVQESLKKCASASFELMESIYDALLCVYFCYDALMLCIMWLWCFCSCVSSPEVRSTV